MPTVRNAIVAGVLALASAVGSVAPGQAAAFFAWRVTDVPSWDTLNLRAYPSSKSKILVAYPNGTLLSLTGPCTDGLNLNSINGWPAWKQRQAVRYRWCQAWVDPTGSGDYRTAWVYGKFITPA